MKKIFRMILAVSMICLCSACSGEKPEASVNAFFAAIERGDSETAQSYVSPDAQGIVASLNTAASTLTEFAKAFTVSEETEKKIESFSSAVMRITYDSHNITGTEKVSDNEYIVKVTLRSADAQSLSNVLATLDYESKTNEFKEEIMHIMQEKGLQEAYSELYGRLFEYLAESVDSIQGNIVYTDSPIQLHVVRNDQKQWLITSIAKAEEDTD